MYTHNKANRKRLLILLKRKTLQKLMVIAAVFIAVGLTGVGWIANVSWDSVSHPMQGASIAIDAGHGGVDGGAVAENGTLEKNIALAISIRLRQLLEQSGAIVVMTREGDHDLANLETRSIRRRKAEDLIKRAEVVNRSGADFMVSIHLNSIPSDKWRGAQTFYQEKKPNNAILAKSIQDELKNQLENTNREAKRISDVFLLRAVNVPASLIEVGFLSNSEERKQLESSEYQQKIAESIYRGLIRYWEQTNLRN